MTGWVLLVSILFESIEVTASYQCVSACVEWTERPTRQDY